MQLRPLGDRVVVKPLEEEERTKGGFVLPDTPKEKPHTVEVVSVGGDGNVEDSLVSGRGATRHGARREQARRRGAHHARPQGPQRRAGKEVRLPHDYARRRDRGQRNRTGRSL